MSRQIHLAPQHPTDADTKIRLVSVGSDSTATIRLKSGAELSAKPGEYFVCAEFGSQGLQLVSASAKSGAVDFELRWSETR